MEEENKSNNQDDTAKSHASLFSVFGCIVFAVIILILVFAILSSNSNSLNNNSSSGAINNESISTTPKLFSRNVKAEDLVIDYEYDFPANIVFLIRPYKNIDNLEITFRHYDKNNELIATQTKIIGNVKEGCEYHTTISLTDLSLTQIFSIEYTKCILSGGTVSYFQ